MIDELKDKNNFGFEPEEHVEERLNNVNSFGVWEILT